VRVDVVVEYVGDGELAGGEDERRRRDRGAELIDARVDRLQRTAAEADRMPDERSLDPAVRR